MSDVAPTEQLICPECKRKLPNDAPDGLCPLCLMGQLLSDSVAYESRSQMTAGPGETLAASGKLSNVDTGRVENTSETAHEFRPRRFGDYELHEEIARGGMGVVYRATQVSLGRTVALKMMRAGKYSSPQDIERLKSEAQAAAQLFHPAIVPVFEIDQHEGLHYFTMAYVEGQSLAQRLVQGPILARQAAEMLLKIAEAIAHAHAAGVIHRDIKPGNILLDIQGQPHVSDFGLAKSTVFDHQLTATGEVLGTPSFMSPEQALGRASQIGPSSDIYGLGALLYVSLTGRPPFQAQSPVETLKLVVEQTPLAPRLMDPSIPKELETICLKCLEKKAELRYASAKDVADELVRFLNGDPIRAKPESNYRKLVRWCQRNAAITVAAASALIMFFAIAGILALTNRQLRGQLTKTIAAESNARQANARAESQLWISLLNGANAQHKSRQPGQRFNALRALEKASELPVPAGHAIDELSSAATAALCLPDIEEAFAYPHNSGTAFCIDPGMRLLGIDDPSSRQFLVRDRFAEQTVLELPTADWLYNYDGPTISPDSRLMAYPRNVNNETRLCLFQFGRREPVYEFDIDTLNIGFSPDGQLCCSVHSDNTIRITDCRQFKELRRFNTQLDRPVAVWNPKFDQLAVMDARGWQVISSETGEEIRTANLPSKTSGWPAWHPSGLRLAISSVDLSIRIWDVETGQVVLESNATPRNGGTILRYSPSGDYLLGNDWGQSVRLISMQSGQEVLTQPMRGVKLDFSRDGQYLAADCRTDQLKIFRFTDTTAIKTVWELPGKESTFHSPHNTPCVDRSGRFLAIRTRHGVCLVDLDYSEVVGRIPMFGNGPLRFEYANDRTYLWTYGQSGLARWPISLDDAKQRGTIGPPMRLAPFAQENKWSSSEDARFFMLPSFTGGVLWDSQSNTTQLFPHPPDCRSVALSSDGKLAVTGSHSADVAGVIVWNRQTRMKIVELPIEPSSVLFSPDSQWLATIGSRPRLYHVGHWDSSRLLGDSTIHCFSPNSRSIACSGGPGQIRLMEVDSGQDVAILQAPERTILNPLCFTPDSRKLISLGSDDAALVIFDLVMIRQELEQLGLDWDYPSLWQGQPRPRGSSPYRFDVEMGDFTRYGDTLQAIKASLVALRSGNIKEAILKLDEAVTLDPMNARANNDLAWHLCTGPAELRDSKKAVLAAKAATTLEPYHAHYQNTLGVALYRDGQYRESIASLTRSTELAGEQDAFDAFYLAMSYWQLGEHERARKIFNDAIHWMDTNDPTDTELMELRKEAMQLVGLQEKDKAGLR